MILDRLNQNRLNLTSAKNQKTLKHTFPIEEPCRHSERPPPIARPAIYINAGRRQFLGLALAKLKCSLSANNPVMRKTSKVNLLLARPANCWIKCLTKAASIAKKLTSLT